MVCLARVAVAMVLAGAVSSATRASVPGERPSSTPNLAQAGHSAAAAAHQDPATPKEQPTTAEGHVKMRDGKPAARAAVVARGPDGTTLKAFADDDGKFELTGPAGSYRLDVQAGAKRGTFSAELKDGKLTPAEFVLN